MSLFYLKNTIDYLLTISAIYRNESSEENWLTSCLRWLDAVEVENLEIEQKYSKFKIKFCSFLYFPFISHSFSLKLFGIRLMFRIFLMPYAGETSKRCPRGVDRERTDCLSGRQRERAHLLDLNIEFHQHKNSTIHSVPLLCWLFPLTFTQSKIKPTDVLMFKSVRKEFLNSFFPRLLFCLWDVQFKSHWTLNFIGFFNRMKCLWSG